jgi:hypothetical protein
MNLASLSAPKRSNNDVSEPVVRLVGESDKPPKSEQSSDRHKQHRLPKEMASRQRREKNAFAPTASFQDP